MAVACVCVQWKSGRDLEFILLDAIESYSDFIKNLGEKEIPKK